MPSNLLGTSDYSASGTQRTLRDRARTEQARAPDNWHGYGQLGCCPLGSAE